MDLLCGFLDPKTIWSDLMLFAAYFDGSGKLHDPNSGYVVLAGVVLDLEAVPVFTSAWAECLRAHSKKAKRPVAQYLQTKEALRCQGEFKNWRLPQVNDLLIDLARLMRQQCYSLIAAPANKQDFKALPEQFQRKLQGLNGLSFEVCINELMNEVGPHDHLHIACDDEEREAVEMYKLLVRYKHRHPSSRDKFVAICFANDRYHPGLQAADLFAYMEREECDRKSSGNPAPPNPIYCELSDGSSDIEYCWTPSEDGLGSARRLVS